MSPVFDFTLKRWIPRLINPGSANTQPELRPTLGCPAHKTGRQDRGQATYAHRPWWLPGCLRWLVCSSGAHRFLAGG